MTTLICDMADCIYRSKKKLRSWKRKEGGSCYGCTRTHAVIGRVFDPDGDIEAVAGKGNTAICQNYTPREETKK